MAAHKHLSGGIFLQSASVADGEKERKRRYTASQSFRHKGCEQIAGKIGFLLEFDFEV